MTRRRSYLESSLVAQHHLFSSAGLDGRFHWDRRYVLTRSVAPGSLAEGHGGLCQQHPIALSPYDCGSLCPGMGIIS